MGLDIDSGYLAAVETAGGRIARATSMELPPGLVQDGEVADLEGLAEALREFTRTHNLPKTVYLGVGNQQIVVRPLDLPRIDDPRERDAALRFQAAEAIAMPLDEAVLDHQVIGMREDPEGGVRMRVIVVAARQAMIEQMVAALRAAGLRAAGIDLNAFALVRALASPGDGDDSSPYTPARVYCHLAGVANFAVALGQSCLFTRTLTAEWRAEGDAAAAAAALAEEIRLSIDFYMTQDEARPVGDVQLSGPGARTEGLADELSNHVALPVTLADPLPHVDAAGLPPEEDPYRHTIATGLALGAAA